MAADAKSLQYRIALVAVLIAGCHRGAKSAAAPGDSLPGSVGSAPAQFSDLPPGDTAAVIAMMRQTMQVIDASLPQLAERDTVVSADSITRHLTLWRQDGVARKLVVIDSTATANSESDVWFMGGDIAVMEQGSDIYAFDAGRIVLWTDDTMQPLADLTPQQVMAKESSLVEMVRGWLGVFGVDLP